MTAGRHWLRFPTRVGIRAKLIFLLAGLAGLSTGLALVLHALLSSDIHAAAESRLERTASAAESLLTDHMGATLERWFAVSRTPEFRANIEVLHAPTLRFGAARLQAQQRAALVAFVDEHDASLAEAGEPELREAALAALSQRESLLAEAGEPELPEPAPRSEADAAAAKFQSADTSACLSRVPADGGGASLTWLPCVASEERSSASLIQRGEATFVVARIPIRTRGRAIGALLAAEQLEAGTLARWSDLLGARMSVVEPEAPLDALAAVVHERPGLQLRVTADLGAERAALAQSRRLLLASGGLAFGFALLLAVSAAAYFVRPIRALQRATERVALGDLDSRVELDRNDEVGDVARAFNAAVEQVRETKQRLVDMAYHDDLTGLPNRRDFQEEVERRFAAGPRKSPFGMVLIDLRHFKVVNDTLGQVAGDRLLCEVSRSLAEVVEGFEGASVWRLASDEFTALTKIEHAERVARAITYAFSRPREIFGEAVSIGVSIGVDPHASAAASPSEAMRSCDIAMREARTRGGDRYVVHDSSMSDGLLRRHDLERRLRAALDGEGGLKLTYQPRVGAADGRIAGFEALLRWTDAELGVVSPAEFVPLAEQRDLMPALGNWVTREAVRQAAEWSQHFAGHAFRISINVSPRQLEGDFVERLEAVLSEYELDAGCLEFEVTETALMRDVERSVTHLERLRALGASVALDDFGTGYSSLGVLRSLPIDVLKIDQGFVADLDERDGGEGVVAAVVALARTFALRIVAEGVETLDQLLLLQELGADEVQGHLFAPALAPEDAARVLELGRLDAKPDEV